MKSLFFALMLSQFSPASAVQLPADVPDQLECKEILLVMGSEGEALNEAKIVFKNLRSKAQASNTYRDRGYVVQGELNDRVTLDFGDGDQLDNFKFKKEEMTELNSKSRKSIRGLRDSGYFWADGLHTDRLVVVECM